MSCEILAYIMFVLGTFQTENKMSYIFWDITPCSPLIVNRRFEGTCRLRLQCRRMSQGEVGSKLLAFNEYPRIKNSS
jgi:hypothetical protein